MLYARDFRQTAREALSGNWGVAIGTGFIAGIFGVSRDSSGSSYRYNAEQFNNNFSELYTNTFFISIAIIVIIFAVISIFFGGVIELGYCRFNLNLVNDTNPRFHDLFSKFGIFWKAFGMRFLIGLYTFLWTLLFIIPGIIASFSYAMTPYILEENPSMGINEAIGRSKEIMDGNKWRLFCLEFSFIGWSLLCILTLGIGFLWLKPYCSAANAAFYNEVAEKNVHDVEDTIL